MPLVNKTKGTLVHKCGQEKQKPCLSLWMAITQTVTSLSFKIPFSRLLVSAHVLPPPPPPWIDLRGLGHRNEDPMGCEPHGQGTPGSLALQWISGALWQEHLTISRLLTYKYH